MGGPEILETDHRLDQPFDRTMILLNEIVQVPDLPDPDGRFPFGVQSFERSPVRAALVDGKPWT